VAAQGSFSAPFSPDDAGASLGGLPVPHLVIGTKADISGGHHVVAGFTKFGVDAVLHAALASKRMFGRRDNVQLQRMLTVASIQEGKALHAMLRRLHPW